MTSVDGRVTDLALARVQIRSVVVAAEVGDPNLACTIIEARVRKCMREGAIGEWRGSQAARIWRVERGWLESGEGGHGTRIWS